MAFELYYGRGLIELFQTSSGGYTLVALMSNIISALDTYTYGTLLGACCLMIIWLIYQKTDSLVAIYFVTVLSTYLLRLTVFAEVSTLFFYIIVLSITAVLFAIIKGKVQ